MDFTAVAAAGAILGLVVASAAFFFIGRRTGTRNELARQTLARASAEETAERIVAEATRDAEALRKTAVLSGKEELIGLREEWEAEGRRRREDLERDERRLQERLAQVDRKGDAIEQREKDMRRLASEVTSREGQLVERQNELDRLVGEERRRLETLAGMSAADAKTELIKRLEEEAHADAANRVREIREVSKRNADREAKKIIALAIQRIAAEQTAETTVSTVALPNDEMKGRIIGREGRNIRAFELATGVDVIIDDTPDTVVVSCFEPVSSRSCTRRAREARRRRANSSRAHRRSRRQSARGSR